MGGLSALYTNIFYSGVINKGLFEEVRRGTPQGGPLSPLLSNIMLNELGNTRNSNAEVSPLFVMPMMNDIL